MAKQESGHNQSNGESLIGRISKNVLLIKQLKSIYSLEQLSKMSPDEVNKASEEVFRSTSKILNMSRDYTRDLSEKELEELAKKDALTIGAKELTACQNAYFAYGKLIKEPTEFPSPRDLMGAQDQLGDIYVGCRLTGKVCIMHLGYNRERGEVRLAFPEEFDVKQSITRTVYGVDKEGTERCPGSKISQKDYKVIMSKDKQNKSKK